MSEESLCPPDTLVFDRFQDFPDCVPLTDEEWTDLWTALCTTYQNWCDANVVELDIFDREGEGEL